MLNKENLCLIWRAYAVIGFAYLKLLFYTFGFFMRAN